MLGNGAAQVVANHGELIAVGLVGVLAEIIIDGLESLGTVVVIRVDHSKGTIHHLAGGQNGMGGAEGLHAAFGNRIPLGQVGQFLKSVLHIDHLGKAVADGSLEGVLDLMLDDEDHGFKAGALGVIDGIVDDQLAVSAHGVDLFQTAVTAAHAGGHDNKNRFLIHFSLLRNQV